MGKAFDPDYYARRLSAEREAAAAATSERAREAHLALADHYRQVLGRLGRPVAVESPDPTTPGEGGAEAA